MASHFIMTRMIRAYNKQNGIGISYLQIGTKKSTKDILALSYFKTKYRFARRNI